jgi:hypothetical protein
MAWIYLAESEESPKPWRGTSSQSPTVKATDTLSQSCSREWHQESCYTRRYGMTSELFGDGLCHYPDMPILFTADSPAKTLALQDAERAWEESEAAFSSRSLGSLARYDHDSCSWKTFQLLTDGAEILSSELWPTSGMTVDGTCFQLQMWARITDDHDGGYWPTPRANSGTGAGIHGMGGLDLQTAVKFATPQARDFRTGESHRWEDKKHRSRNLNDQIGGQLNPTWVEWLMGYPFEWTVLEPWAMQWFRPKRGKRLKDSSDLKNRELKGK